MIEYIKGDVIEAFDNCQESCCLLHQENCQSIGKAGFAKTLYYKYPEANPNRVMSSWFGNYKSTIINKIRYKSKIIINLYSQYYPGHSSSKTFNIIEGYEIIDNYYNRIVALKTCLIKFSIEKMIGYTIYMPLIASGLAKDYTKEFISDLDYFKKYTALIVEEELKDFNVKVYYL